MTITFNTQTRPMAWTPSTSTGTDIHPKGLFLTGFDAATEALQEARRTRTSPALGWHGALGAMLLDWRTNNAHLSYADQTAALGELRRGWAAAEQLGQR